MIECLLVCAALAQPTPEDRIQFAMDANVAIGQMMVCDAKFVDGGDVPARVYKKMYDGASPELMNQIRLVSDSATKKGIEEQRKKRSGLSCEQVKQRYTALGLSLLDVDVSPKAPQ